MCYIINKPTKLTPMTSETKFMSGSQIENLYKAREKAQELTTLLGHFPCWVFDAPDSSTLFDSLDKIRTILNTTEEWKNLNSEEVSK